MRVRSLSITLRVRDKLKIIIYADAGGGMEIFMQDKSKLFKKISFFSAIFALIGLFLPILQEDGWMSGSYSIVEFVGYVGRVKEASFSIALLVFSVLAVNFHALAFKNYKAAILGAISSVISVAMMFATVSEDMEYIAIGFYVSALASIISAFCAMFAVGVDSNGKSGE